MPESLPKSLPELRGRIVKWLAHRMPNWAELDVVSLERIHGGASRQTYRARLSYTESGKHVTRGIIVRRDPEGSLIETERETEFAAYQAFYGTGIPVPEALALELDESWLGSPFFVMDEIPDCLTGSALSADSYGEHAAIIGNQFWTMLGDIAAADPVENGLVKLLDVPEPDQCWRRELDYWEGVIDEDELSPQPIVRAAIRWLRRRPPPPAQKICVVHGDYRSGNFLHDGKGSIKAVLDWEMAHLGDPLEDIGWALDPLWTGSADAPPGGMIDRAGGLTLWADKSGLSVDPEALLWWEVFAGVKGIAIWTSSLKEFLKGSNHDSILALSGWYVRDKHNQLLAQRMALLAMGDSP